MTNSVPHCEIWRAQAVEAFLCTAISLALALSFTLLNVMPVLADGFAMESDLASIVEAIQHIPCPTTSACVIEYGRNYAKIQVGIIDLSGSGTTAYLVHDLRQCGSAGCQTEILWNDGQRWRWIFGGYSFLFLKTKTSGFFDIIQGYKGPGFESHGPFPVYRWNGNSYRFSGSVQIKPSE